MFVVNRKRVWLLLEKAQASDKIVQRTCLAVDDTVYLIPVLHEQRPAAQIHFEEVGVIEIAVGIEEHLFLQCGDRQPGGRATVTLAYRVRQVADCRVAVDAGKTEWGQLFCQAGASQAERQPGRRHDPAVLRRWPARSEEHTSELQSLA